MEYVLRKKTSLLLLVSAPLARLLLRSFVLSLHPLPPLLAAALGRRRSCSILLDLVSAPPLRSTWLCALLKPSQALLAPARRCSMSGLRPGVARRVSPGTTPALQWLFGSGALGRRCRCCCSRPWPSPPPLLRPSVAPLPRLLFPSLSLSKKNPPLDF